MVALSIKSSPAPSSADVLPGPGPNWRRKAGPLPGFGLGLGITLAWLGLIVLLPLSALVLGAAGLDAADWWAILANGRVQHALALSFGTAFVAALVNVPMALLLGWVLVRYRFPGRGLLDAVIDLPFALPTAVAGISLAALYAETGWIGRFLVPIGIEVAYAPLGIVVALVFVGLPFGVRTVQPVLEQLGREHEEAAATLGAGRWRTFSRVLLPQLAPALLTGFTLAFARGVGEYGSVIFIAGNLPNVSEIAPLLVIIRLEEFDYAGAMAVATLMLALSFLCLLTLNLLHRRLSRVLGP